ncbi:hypothetical protein DPMN_027353 [Dreissena polymorpha]|uniref:Uncharacterized protein n=1 Tax=Dreissena polymorpha TaxID=45954 RepID=A0A9D4LUL1_DREPO|nr:hypothetical protein DPMN_027353 [Dreissena polymorpha]
MDDTQLYDFEELLEEQVTACAGFPRMINEEEASDILKLFIERKKSKWENSQPHDIINLISKSLSRLLKDELHDIAKYLNLKLIGTTLELKVKSVTKSQLLEQLSGLFCTNIAVKPHKASVKSTRLKSLQDLA